MRPTVPEQLAGIRRVLGEVVAPEVTGAYPADMLRSLLGALEVLESAVSGVEPFLRWDHDETGRLLRLVAAALGPDLDPAAAAAIDAGCTDGAGIPSDPAALAAACTERRRLLAEVVPLVERGGARAGEARDAIRAHLRARADRYPFAARR